MATAILCAQAPSVAQPEEPPPPPRAEPSPAPPPSAEPSPPPPPSAAQESTAAPAVDEAALALARKNAEAAYNAGRELWKRGEYAAALARYQSSLRFFPTWSARTGAGACLVKLQRYDEALDAFQSALREVGDRLPAKTKASVLEQIDLMRSVTGMVMVTGAAPGAIVVVDGRLRGEHPLGAPVPVLVGPHLIRVYKEGFGIYEEAVDVAKGNMATLPAALKPLAETGRLKVGEVNGRKMEVVVDGVPVGETPWEGPVSPGPHSVHLRPITPKRELSPLTCDETIVAAPEGSVEEQELGTEPVSVIVKAGGTTPVQLKVERLGAVLRITPNPATAGVYINGVYVGRGGYVGRAKPGKHVVKLSEDGYVPVSQTVEAKVDQDNAPPGRLRKDWSSPRWAERGRFLVEARGDLALTPSLGGEIASGCDGLCQSSLGVGARFALRGGYEFPGGLNIGLTAGYFQMQQTITGRPTSFSIIDRETNQPTETRAGTANHTVNLRDFMAGAYGSLRLSERFPVRLGLTVGALLGSVEDSRIAIIDNNATGPVVQSGFFPWLFVEPEVQVGLRLGEHFSVGVGFSAMVLVPPRVPLWTEQMQINAHDDDTGDDVANDDLGQFSAETITGSVVVAMTQGLYIRYGF
ncbi:PEGA domain-containing protein [Sorangium cellulosum]|uniref:PEGA domain-containing protein n=1 Tax=Sorangium cellulosum TaxID=56 RepID=UPI000CF47088|nr:PEGA domain-containing protein [Sorangium cellulosum]